MGQLSQKLSFFDVLSLANSDIGYPLFLPCDIVEQQIDSGTDFTEGQYYDCVFCSQEYFFLNHNNHLAFSVIEISNFIILFNFIFIYSCFFMKMKVLRSYLVKYVVGKLIYRIF